MRIYRSLGTPARALRDSGKSAQATAGKNLFAARLSCERVGAKEVSQHHLMPASFFKVERPLDGYSVADVIVSAASVGTSIGEIETNVSPSANSGMP